MVEIMTYTPRQRVEEAVRNMLNHMREHTDGDVDRMIDLITETLGYSFVRTSNPKGIAAVMESEYQNVCKRRKIGTGSIDVK